MKMMRMKSSLFGAMTTHQRFEDGGIFLLSIPVEACAVGQEFGAFAEGVVVENAAGPVVVARSTCVALDNGWRLVCWSREVFEAI